MLIQCAAAAVITALLLAGAEWAAGRYLQRRRDAILAANPELSRTDFVAGVRAWMDINPVPLAEDPELLWRNRPGGEKTQPVNPEALDRPRSWTVKNDARGYRDGPRVLAADHTGVYRVLCVGDSITFGFNVDAADAYPRQLEALLATRHPGRRFEVINAGVAGWSWVQGRRYLEIEGLALRPDVVVIGHGTNDQFFPATVTDNERIGRSDGRLRRAFRKLASALAHTNLYRLAALLTPPRNGPSAGCAAQPPGACRRVALPEIGDAVADVSALARAAGADLLVLNTDFMETPAIEGLRPAVAASKLPFVDLVARFHAQRTEAETRRARELGLAPASPLDAPAPGAPRRVLLRVVARQHRGPVSVQGSGYFQDAFRFDVPAYDDGTHGDEKAGDGVFTAALEVPADIHALEYKYFADGRPELASLPPLPSTQGVRLLPVGDGVRGPVELFGELEWMAERTHPNAEGQAVVAAAVADELATLPSFRRFLDGAPPQDEARAQPR